MSFFSKVGRFLTPKLPTLKGSMKILKEMARASCIIAAVSSLNPAEARCGRNSFEQCQEIKGKFKRPISVDISEH